MFSSVEMMGEVLLELGDHNAGQSHGNPVIDYLQCHSRSIEQPLHFDNAIPLNGKTELAIRPPSSSEG